MYDWFIHVNDRNGLYFDGHVLKKLIYGHKGLYFDDDN